MTLAPVPSHPRRLVYLGTPDASVPPFEALVGAGYEVALVVTAPDKRRGRGGSTSPSPVKATAERLGIPVAHDVDRALDTNADLGVVVAFGRLIRPHVLEHLPMVNLHFSLLPRWRGAAPVERAILAGDDVTGVCLMQLEEGLDTGPVFAREAAPIDPDVTADELRRELVRIGSALLVRQLRDGLADPTPQVGEVTYAAKIDPGELRIDWSRTAPELGRLVRVGGAWTTFRGRRLKVLEARLVDATGTVAPAPGSLAGDLVTTGSGALQLVRVQPEGRAPMTTAAWRRGARPASGEVLGDSG